MEISKGLQEEILTVQNKLKNAIRDHQICVGRLKEDPNNSHILGQIQEIHLHIVSLGRCQKQVVQRLRKEVEAFKAESANGAKVSVATLLGLNNNNRITNNNETVKHEGTGKRHEFETTKSSKEDYEEIVKNTDVSSPIHNAALPSKKRASSVETISGEDDVIEVFMDENSNEKEEDLESDYKIEPVEKLSFLCTLGLITTVKCAELQNKRAERKRRSTANPQFIYTNLEVPTKRKRHSYLQSIANAPQTRRSTARTNTSSPPTQPPPPPLSLSQASLTLPPLPPPSSLPPPPPPPPSPSSSPSPSPSSPLSSPSPSSLPPSTSPSTSPSAPPTSLLLQPLHSPAPPLSLPLTTSRSEASVTNRSSAVLFKPSSATKLSISLPQKTVARPNILRNITESKGGKLNNKVDSELNRTGSEFSGKFGLSSTVASAPGKTVHIPGLPSSLTIERIESDSVVCMSCRNPGTLTICEICASNYHVSCHTVSPAPPGTCPKCTALEEENGGSSPFKDEEFDLTCNEVSERCRRLY